MLKYLNTIQSKYFIKQANFAYNKNKWQKCIFYYAQALRLGCLLSDSQTFQFNQSRYFYRQEQSVCKSLRIAVSGWDLSHNAAGRALTLANLYQFYGYDTNIIGCTVSNKKTKLLWEPMRLSQIDCLHFDVRNVDDLLNKAYMFVSENPFDIVHLSKPRLPNLVIGRLYQLLWDSKVIVDIDDEELGFGETNPIVNLASTDELKNIRHVYWLHHCVDRANRFSSVTVSNVALQNKYGGIIIPHVRDANTFQPSNQLTKNMRDKYDIAENDWVVLFFGTPKPHKGLTETVQALSELDRQDVVFLIIGDFIDQSFRQTLINFSNVRFKFLPNQPYHEIPQFVAMGDVCILMQQQKSLIAEYQLPAKMIDALAMGLTVICSETKALKPLIDKNIVCCVKPNELVGALTELFNDKKCFNHRGREYFLNNLSVQSHSEKLKSLLQSEEEKIADLTAEQLYDVKNLLL